MGCKRITVSNQYLAVFKLPNAHLITKPIQETTESGISIQDMTLKHIEFDAIIYATGFDILGRIKTLCIERPKDGELLSDVWGNRPSAYLGIMQPGFPNLFILTIISHSK